MWQYIAKIVLTAAVVVVVSEIAKRSTLLGAALVDLDALLLSSQRRVAGVEAAVTRAVALLS